MKIYHDLSEITYEKNSIVTLGTFDGVHLGHQKILKEVVDRSRELNSKSFLLTFDPHPRKVVSQDYKLHVLSTLDEKMVFFANAGIDDVLVVNFTNRFSQLSPGDFILKYLVEGIGVSEVVIGYDHHFGKGRNGDFNFLVQMGKDHNFKVTTVSEYSIGNSIISSTKIRKALIEGDIKKANKMFGRLYRFSGKVIHGDKRGKKLGFPTANLKIEDKDKLLPAIGIYAIECYVKNKKHYGLLSVGKRPTFHEDGDVVPEVYIFDFNENIYNMVIEVSIVERIRGEEKFISVEDLIRQMEKDKEKGLEIFSNIIN